MESSIKVLDDLVILLCARCRGILAAADQKRTSHRVNLVIRLIETSSSIGAPNENKNPVVLSSEKAYERHLDRCATPHAMRVSRDVSRN